MSGASDTIKGLALTNFTADVTLQSASDTLSGCFVGLKLDGTTAGPNAVGVSVAASGGATIGGTTAADHNIISNNTQHGIIINAGAPSGSGSTVAGNEIGTSLNGTSAAGNGIKISASSANTVAGNFVGTNSTGSAVAPNGLVGVLVNGTSANAVGGTVSGAGNEIAGNVGVGVELLNTDSVAVAGNSIGFDTAGNAIIANGAGVLISGSASSNNTIGESGSEAQNLIIGNVGEGVEFLGFVPAPSSGGVPAANASGVSVLVGSQHVVGGASPDARNVISGNRLEGVALISSSNTVEGNLIGTNPSGTGALSNGTGVVALGGPNTIGGTGGGAANIISGNTFEGVGLRVGSDTSKVQGNMIGIGATSAALPNGGNGVTVTSSTVVSVIANDIIAHNGGAGVQVHSSSPSPTNASVKSNSIYANGGLGIDLDPPGAVNCDAGSPPTANDGILCPSITSVSATQFSGTACKGCTVDIFTADVQGNDQGHGEGKTLFCSSIADSNTGQWTFFPTVSQNAASHLFTATATQQVPGGAASRLENSEFSLDFGGLPTAIAKGWNLLSIPLAGTGITSASSLVANTTSHGVAANTIAAVATFTNGRFALFVPGFSADLPLQPSQGVFVLSKVAGTWTPIGSAFTAGQTVTLQRGWNATAAPFPQEGLDAAVLAAQIDPSCSSSACSVKEIAILTGTGYKTYVPGSSNASFTVPATAGVWIEMSARTTWQPH